MNSQRSIDSISVGESSRLSVAGIYAFDYNGSRGETDDESDNVRNDGGDFVKQQQSQYPMSQFTCENDFMYYTQDEDHDSRRVGLSIRAVGKPYRGK